MKVLLKISALTVLLALGAIAQEERAAITGTVTDPSKGAISGARITLDSPAIGFHRVVDSNNTGSYLIPGLAIGNYSLTIARDGFRTVEYKALDLAVGQTRTFTTQLQIASIAQEVQVESATVALDESSSKVAGVISSTQVSELPINGRAWTALMALVPGAMDSGGGTQKSIRFAGRGGDDSNYRFDGVDASGISAQAPNTSTRLQISTEAIAEFKVDTMLYGAETGGSAGGQVEVISKSGSNQFHGSAFEYLRNDALNTRGPFDGATLPPLRLNQLGGSAGGAVIKNRTFYFVAYEALRQRLGTTLIGNVLSDSVRAQVIAQSPVLAPIVNAFPVGNRALNATTAQYVHVGSILANEDSGLIRIDHRISDSTNFYARYNIDQVHLASPSGNLLDTTQTDTAPMNGALSLSHVFTPTMFNVLQLGVNRIYRIGATDSHLFDTTKVFNSFSIPGYDKLSQSSASVGAPGTYTLKDDFTWTRGDHTLKGGVEIKRVIYNYSQASENAIVYASLAGFMANQVDQVNLIGGVPMHSLIENQYFGYLQDTWKVRPNLTANIGLRYEFFNAFHEQYGRDLPFDDKTCGGFCPVGSAFGFPDTKNFEPRISLAWSPKFLGNNTVIRAGSGMYKGQGQLGDLNAPSDNYTTRLSLSSVSFPGLQYPADRFYAAAANQAVTPRDLNRDRKDPTVIQWGLQIQTALPGGFILDTGYIGYHGYHQFTRWYFNGCLPGTVTTGCVRPLPAFGPIDSKQTDSNNHFHGWQTSLTRHTRAGLSFGANYMWSHAINDDSTGGGETDYPQINLCRACDTASSDADIRHTFSVNSVYELPLGKGKQFLNQSKVADAIVGGWQLSGTGTARTGTPVNVTLTRNATAVPDGLSLENGASFQRPNCVGGVSLVPSGQNINNWINKAAFATPADLTYGNCGRNLIRGPGFWQADSALSRNFRLTERFVLIFRLEGFNVFNRAQYGNPSGNFSSGSFGKITSTINGSSPTGSGTPRQFQIAMRLRF